jgi:hypothetical protein
MWNPQRFKWTAAGLEMTMETRGNVEGGDLGFGFGDRARVQQPTQRR